jgi:putative membrane-bound dehydrogenase-like protein
MKTKGFLKSLILASVLLSAWCAHSAAPLRILFLGDNGHHRPADRFAQMQPALSSRGIELTYTDKLDDLNPAKLARYDALLIFANYTRISPEQESALLNYVASGHGLVPVHCASYCFLNSPKYIELVGGQFQRHGTGTFKDTIVNADHPIMKGLQPIESWDETYVHTKHNSNRIVLAERRDDRGNEPYTWVREHGKGRVFYTAWGHDQRTWGNAQFVTLIDNGIRWAASGGEPDLVAKKDLPPLKYASTTNKIPNYPAGQRWGVVGEPITEMQLPLSPQESAKRVVMRPGFEAKLWATEPDIYKPLCMAFDERGRLWIAESIDYPNEQQPEGEGRDRITICEDTDGDGKADKFKVFADKLSIPTGMVFANGGLIVKHDRDMLFLKDTNGDDKVDERKVLFTGWGMRDTHATASNLRYGLDNWIWGTVGYSGFNGTVGGKQIRFGQGVFRFKPDGSVLEFVKSSNNNTWGLGLSEEGIVFGSTANNNASFYMAIPNRYYEAVLGWSASAMGTIADSQAFYPVTKYVRQVDQHGRYTAGAGHALYTARAFPKEYWNKVAFVAEPTGHLVGQFRLLASGTDFIAHNEHSFLASDDEWFAPIIAEVGPDGQMWMVDWYNYIIQHNPTPAGFRTGRGAAYETPLRDKTHGRIYRIIYMGTKETADARTADEESERTRVADKEAFSLKDASPQQLVDALKNNNQLWRMHAQRLIVTRGNKDVVPALCELVRDNSVDEIGLNVGAMHALWTLQGLGALDSAGSDATKAALGALKHPSAGVRRASLMTLPRVNETTAAILSGKLLADSDAQVRMAALLALAELPASDEAGAAILAMLKLDENSKDRWIPNAATAAAARHDAGFLKAVLAGVSAPGTAKSKSPSANLVANDSFENERDGGPLEWNTSTHSGRGELTIGNVGHTGSRSAKISSTAGGDISWSQRVNVEPNVTYKLTAWIKTEDVRGALGALLNMHELQSGTPVRTRPVTGTKDWTEVETEFNSGDNRTLTINCLFGGWGRSTGTAWFDDVKLVQVGSATTLPGALGTAVRIVTGHFAQRAPVESVVPTLLALDGASPSIAVPLLDGLAANWPRETVPKISSADESKLNALMASLPNDARSSLLTLAERWGKKEMFASAMGAIAKQLRAQVADAKLTPEERTDAAQRLVSSDDSTESVNAILAQISPTSLPALASGLLGALADSRLSETGPAVIASFGKFTPAARRSALATVLRRGEWAAALLNSIESRQLQRTDLGAEYWAQLKAHSDKDVAAKANELDKTVAVSSAEMEAVVKKLMPIAQQQGDVTRGKELFTTTCAVCHTLGGQGAQIGPDLTGAGAKPRADVLIEIIDPNRSVEANYRMWNVTTKDGDNYSGRLDSETATSIDLLDTAGKKHTLQRKDIAEMNASALSIMPTGFEQLPPHDLASILEYIATSGHTEAKK